MSDTFYNPIDLAETPSLGNPPNGFQRIVARPDGKLYSRSSAGVELELTPGAGGGGTQTELRVDGGGASTIFNNYLLRLDFGSNGASINPTGTP